MALEQLPTEVAVSLSGEPYLDTFLCHLPEVTLPWQGGGLKDLQRSLPAPAIPWLREPALSHCLAITTCC